MFSKSRTDTVPQPAVTPPAQTDALDQRASFAQSPAAPKAKPAASILSSDITVVGNLRSSGDIQIEGTVEGDVRSQIVIVGETATVRGEVVAEEVVVHGRVVGRLRGVKVRLTATARVEGDIVHKTIAIENGAHFEGSVQRQDDPIAQGAPQAQPPARLTGPRHQAPAPVAEQQAS
jgi:cytoskeletal protein CcmA (bactofilin family)